MIENDNEIFFVFHLFGSCFFVRLPLRFLYRIRFFSPFRAFYAQAIDKRVRVC